MNRREMIQAGLSVITACGLEGEVKSLDNINDPQAIVLLFPTLLSEKSREALNQEWKRVFSGKPLGEVPVIVLDGGADIKVVDRKEIGE